MSPITCQKWIDNLNQPRCEEKELNWNTNSIPTVFQHSIPNFCLGHPSSFLILIEAGCELSVERSLWKGIDVSSWQLWRNWGLPAATRVSLRCMQPWLTPWLQLCERPGAKGIYLSYPDPRPHRTSEKNVYGFQLPNLGENLLCSNS